MAKSLPTHRSTTVSPAYTSTDPLRTSIPSIERTPTFPNESEICGGETEKKQSGNENFTFLIHVNGPSGRRSSARCYALVETAVAELGFRNVQRFVWTHGNDLQSALGLNWPSILFPSRDVSMDAEQAKRLAFLHDFLIRRSLAKLVALLSYV